MAAELLTLEELVAKATDITNYKSNDSEALSVANQVNREIGGPNSCVKLLIKRLQLRQEVVTLQVLNVIECCVKNCGVKFHNEIGKYKFINELIKLLSPKYDADITPQSVKERVTELLFAWYVGLPQEKKIGEAYKMLKQQGIVKKDPIDPYKQGLPLPPREPQNTAFEDEGKSELLKTLLTSNNPDDLQSANKLIKSMVKEEEQRLERVSKRIQDLETVSNNVRLLDEMLAKHTQATSQTDLEIMNDLYETCLKLRPELFRLASKSAEDKDDAMAEILCASDELTRAIDSYKEIVLMQKIDKNREKPYTLNNDFKNTSSLLDLDIDLNIEPSEEQSKETQQTTTTTTTNGNTLLDEQFKLLGLDVPDTQCQSVEFDQFSQLFQQPSRQQTFSAVNTFSMNMSQPGGYLGGQAPFYTASTTGTTTNIQPFIGGMRPSASNTSNASMAISSTNKTPKKTTGTPQRKDILDFDVFSDFKNSDFAKPKAVSKYADTPDGASQSVVNHLLDLSTDDLPLPSLSSPSLETNLAKADPITASVGNTDSPVTSITKQSEPILTVIDASQSSASASPQPCVAPTQSTDFPPVSTNQPSQQDTYSVPLEALKLGEHDPVVVLDKCSLKTFLNVATDTRANANANVIVTILSTISMNTASIKDLTIQVAVPKVMRVKLQPATSNQLSPFNPLLPPSSVTQVMLIANPTKETVRLRFRINFTINGVEHTETSSIDQLPLI